jgi:hypothetical protein
MAPRMHDEYHQHHDRSTDRHPDWVAETMTTWGFRCSLNGLLSCPHARIPPTKDIPERIIEHMPPHLEERVGAAIGPLHLLPLHQAFADHLIHRRLGHSGRDRFPVAVPIPIIRYVRLVRRDVAPKLPDRREKSRNMLQYFSGVTRRPPQKCSAVRRQTLLTRELSAYTLHVYKLHIR